MEKYKFANKNLNQKIFRLQSISKIIMFKRKQDFSITDKDYISMFMGIIKLIRQEERSKILAELKNKLSIHNKE